MQCVVLWIRFRMLDLFISVRNWTLTLVLFPFHVLFRKFTASFKREQMNSSPRAWIVTISRYKRVNRNLSRHTNQSLRSSECESFLHLFRWLSIHSFSTSPLQFRECPMSETLNHIKSIGWGNGVYQPMNPAITVSLLSWEHKEKTRLYRRVFLSELPSFCSFHVALFNLFARVHWYVIEPQFICGNCLFHHVSLLRFRIVSGWHLLI